jgi:hypothetical protein
VPAPAPSATRQTGKQAAIVTPPPGATGATSPTKQTDKVPVMASPAPGASAPPAPAPPATRQTGSHAVMVPPPPPASISAAPVEAIAAPVAEAPASAPSVGPAVAPAVVAAVVAAQQGMVMPPPAFPPSGAIEKVTPAQSVAVANVIAVLNMLDYFQVLRIAPDAAPGDIKKAFYRESRVYHPDRFFHLPDDEVKGDIVLVYKRITEAYYFLKDDVKRKKYLTDIGGAERRGKLRFNEISEVETKAQAKKEAEEQIGVHPKARAFYATAMKDMDAQNWAAAKNNLKMALTYEGGNARYKEKLAEVQVKLDEAFKSSGDKFKIR